MNLSGLQVHRIKLDRFGYAPNGQYFGIGEKLWHFTIFVENEYREGYIRAETKIRAKEKIIEDLYLRAAILNDS